MKACEIALQKQAFPFDSIGSSFVPASVIFIRMQDFRTIRSCSQKGREIITRLTADFGSTHCRVVNAPDWFYEADGASVGPITAEELVLLQKSGRIGRKTQVSSKTGTAGSWVSFESIAAKLGNSDVSRPEEKERKTEAFAYSQGSSGPADSDSKTERELIIVGDTSPSQGSGVKKWVVLVIIIAVIGWFAFSKIKESREAAKKQEITELIKEFSEYVPLLERINRAQGFDALKNSVSTSHYLRG